MLVASACRPGFSLLRRLQVGVLAEALGQRKTLCMADEAKADPPAAGHDTSHGGGRHEPSSYVAAAS